MTDQPQPGPADRPEDSGSAADGQTSRYPGYDPYAETNQYPRYPEDAQYGRPSPSPTPYPTSPYPQYSQHDGQQYYQHPYGGQYAQPQYPPAQYPPAQYPQYPQYGYPYGQPVPPPPPPQGGTGRSLLVGFGAALAATAIVIGGVALTSNDSSTTDRQGAFDSPSLQPIVPASPAPGSSGSAGSAARSGPANATQQIGVVTILSTLKYQNALSAGTGMIMSSDGTVLTNNHVVRGATSIQVTVQSTGRSYQAKVVGTAPKSDVAVIKLSNASGLRSAAFADDAGAVRVGDRIVGVGNGGGTGKLTAAAGKVTALNQTITASDGQGGQSERLSSLIEVDAKIISGDSGGPLYDADTKVIGMDTAASAQRTATASAYAIPIEDAMDLARQIESGVETADIRIGYPGFLGITTRPAGQQGGAQVVRVLDGLPAADAGLTVGSVITSADGVRVTSAAELTDALSGRDPGDRVDIAWTTPSGQKQSATITLTKGPAD